MKNRVPEAVAVRFLIVLLAFSVAIPSWGTPDPNGDYLRELRGPLPLDKILAQARDYADACQKTSRMAAQVLNPLSLKNLQIRSALNDTLHWAEALVEAAASPVSGDSPDGILATLKHLLRNVGMWAGTVSYHLAEAADTSSVKKVRNSWVAAEVLRKDLDRLLNR